MRCGFGSTGIVIAAVLSGWACGGSNGRVLESYAFTAPGRGVELDAAAVLRVSGAPLGACHEVRLPWQGAALCGPDAVLRPRRGTCSVFSDHSPRVDAIGGFFRADADSRNWFSTVPEGVLELLAAYVIDNGEGDDPPHGPYGNLYWDVFGPFEPLMASRDGARQRRLGKRSHVLRGPHRTHGTTDEWLDDEVLTYRQAGLLRWGAFPGTEDAVVLRIWESDGDEDGFLGRRNDVLGMEFIRRRDTEQPCGLWVPFYRYTNGHPRKRTGEPALWLLVRTRRPPAPFGVLAELEETRQ
jgi:hypothetical protein